MDIGFIGLGRMGHGMAANLVNAGHTVTVYNRTAAKAEALARQGARVAHNVAEVCDGDVVITMLADDAAVEEVVFGEQGILASLAPGATHISSSTISVDLSRRLTAAHDAAEQHYVAAPVFGRPEAAAAAKLFVIAAGAPQRLEALAQVFDTIGQRTFVVSEQQHAANLVKLTGNFLIASVIESLGEVIALVGKAGVDPQHYVEILTSTLFDAPAYQTYGGLIAREWKTSGWRWPLPKSCRCRCRSAACCATASLRCWPTVAHTWIGRRSPHSPVATQAWNQTTPRRPSAPNTGSSIALKSGPRRNMRPPSTLMICPVT
jgi:3-hydroxyisobutyrate dehydrogenase-like beta-hydroxyacid dehydrogenase